MLPLEPLVWHWFQTLRWNFWSLLQWKTARLGSLEAILSLFSLSLRHPCTQNLVQNLVHRERVLYDMENTPTTSLPFKSCQECCIKISGGCAFLWNLSEMMETTLKRQWHSAAIQQMLMVRYASSTLLVTEVTPLASPLPKPCHANTLQIYSLFQLFI